MDDERDAKTRKSATDPIFKQVMLTLFQGWAVDIQTEVEVGLAPLRVDVVIGIRRQEVLGDLLDQTPFGHFQNDNIVEFKGLGDALTIDNVYRIVMRSYHYFLERGVSVSDLTVTIICARTPRKVLAHPGFGFQKIAEGYYLCDALGVPVYLIATNELPLEPMYYSLLLFASSKVRSQTIIEDIVKNKAEQYFAPAFLLHPKTTVEVLDMAKRRDQLEENLKIIARDMGPRLIPFINPEDLFRESTPEQRLEGLDAQQRLEGLDAQQRLEGLDAQQRLEGLDAQQRLEGLDAQQRLEGLDAQQRLEGLTPAQQLQGLSPEDIRDALSDEDRQALRQLLDDQDNGP